MSLCIDDCLVCKFGCDCSLIQTCTLNGHLYRVTCTRCRIDTINSPNDGHMTARNMHRIEINIHEKELCVKVVIYKDRCMILFETILCLHINGFATHVFPPECSEISLLQSLLHTHQWITVAHFLVLQIDYILISTGTWSCYGLYFRWLKVHWLNTEVMRLQKQREHRVRKKRNLYTQLN